MRYAVVICTRDRISTLRKTLPLWAEQDLPVALLTEAGQWRAHVQLIDELGLSQRQISVLKHPKPNMGIGYARKRAVEICHTFNVGAFVMADDDTKVTQGNVRCLLDFVGRDKKAIICAGWMPNYGLWVPDGNLIAKEPDQVIPCGGARDRVFAVNVDMALAAGNFDPALKTLDTQEMNRLGIKNKHLWWIHSGCHVGIILKPHAEGGIQALYKTPEERATQNQRDHEHVFKKWGPLYVSHPSKRMATKWLKMAEDFIGPRAKEAIRAASPYPASRVQPAERMFSRR